MVIFEKSKFRGFYFFFVYSLLFSSYKFCVNGTETSKSVSEDTDISPVNKYQPTSSPIPGGNRKGKDLIYEAMKMRTGIWPPQGKDLDKVVGGGLLEKQLLSSPVFSQARENPDVAIRFESRGKYQKNEYRILYLCYEKDRNKIITWLQFFNFQRCNVATSCRWSLLVA